MSGKYTHASLTFFSDGWASARIAPVTSLWLFSPKIVVFKRHMRVVIFRLESISFSRQARNSLRFDYVACHPIISSYWQSCSSSSFLPDTQWFQRDMMCQLPWSNVSLFASTCLLLEELLRNPESGGIENTQLSLDSKRHAWIIFKQLFTVFCFSLVKKRISSATQ